MFKRCVCAGTFIYLFIFYKSNVSTLWKKSKLFPVIKMSIFIYFCSCFLMGFLILSQISFPWHTYCPICLCVWQPGNKAQIIQGWFLSQKCCSSQTSQFPCLLVTLYPWHTGRFTGISCSLLIFQIFQCKASSLGNICCCTLFMACMVNLRDF